MGHNKKNGDCDGDGDDVRIGGTEAFLPAAGAFVVIDVAFLTQFKCHVLSNSASQRTTVSFASFL